MQNGAPKGSPLGEDDLENFYKRNLTRFVMVALGSQGLPWSPKGLPSASWGGVGAPRGYLIN